MADERRIAAAALVLAPALFLVSNLLHPKELAAGHEAAQLAKIADAYQRWQGAHFVSLLSLLVFVAAVGGLALLVHRGNPRMAVAGGALGLAGLVGLGGALAIDGFSWGIAGEVWGKSDAYKPAAEAMLKDMQHSEWALPFYLMGVAWILGLLVLGLAAYRLGLVPAWPPALLVLGALMVGLELAIHSNVYFVIAASVLLAGGIAMALALRRSPAAAAPEPPAAA